MHVQPAPAPSATAPRCLTEATALRLIEQIDMAARCFASLRAAAERPTSNYESMVAIQDARDYCAKLIERYAEQLCALPLP